MSTFHPSCDGLLLHKPLLPPRTKQLTYRALIGPPASAKRTKKIEFVKPAGSCHDMAAASPLYLLGHATQGTHVHTAPSSDCSVIKRHSFQQEQVTQGSTRWQIMATLGTHSWGCSRLYPHDGAACWSQVTSPRRTPPREASRFCNIPPGALPTTCPLCPPMSYGTPTKAVMEVQPEDPLAAAAALDYPAVEEMDPSLGE